VRARRWTAVAAALTALAGSAVLAVATPAGATPAFDEASFRAAWTADATTSIDLTADITLTCPGGTSIRSATAGPLTVDGHGHTIMQTCAANGVLQADGTASTAFANITLTGGQANTGGGLKTKGPTTFTNSQVIGNAAVSSGGGISALAPLGTVTLTNSSVANNQSAAGGGGIETAGTATLTDSTVDHNTTTGGGGGIAAVAGVTLTRSTISHNTSTAGGGGIGAASVTATNATISNNTAGVAGGGGITAGTATLAYTTLAQNQSSLGANLIAPTLTSFGSVVALPIGGGANCVTTLTNSDGYNFADDSSCSFNQAGIGDRQNAGNPNLGALGNNGGPTATLLPQTGSPLIDAIPDPACQTAPLATGITTDQRSLARPSLPSGACDVGAVEVQVPVVPPTSPATAPAAPPAGTIASTPRFTG
jgi:hypothetical protein